MKTLIRKARPEDAAAFMAIKAQLPMPQAENQTQQGGFLLGTDEETYRTYILHGQCLVAESAGALVGFGICFPDALVRASEIWQRRDAAQWYIDPASFEQNKLGYIEQMAFLPGHRKAVIALAYNLICWALESGAEVLFTTTVRKPVLNLAAVPLILAGGGQRVGTIDEVYPVVGPIVSDIYLLRAGDFWTHTRSHPLYSYFEGSRTRFA
jgi:hypothetical protein